MPDVIHLTILQFVPGSPGREGGNAVQVPTRAPVPGGKVSGPGSGTGAPGEGLASGQVGSRTGPVRVQSGLASEQSPYGLGQGVVWA